jgi:hypothetical protein
MEKRDIMVLSRWLQKQLKNTDIWHRLNERLYALEKLVEVMKAEKDIQKEIQKEVQKETEVIGSPTIIEYVNVEKIIVDRYEQSNNFGALGIKSLEGRLNIGANYGLTDIPDDKEKSIEDKLKKTAILYNKKPKKPEHTKTPPKTTIRSRTSGDAS